MRAWKRREVREKAERDEVGRDRRNGIRYKWSSGGRVERDGQAMMLMKVLEHPRPDIERNQCRARSLLNHSYIISRTCWNACVLRGRWQCSAGTYVHHCQSSHQHKATKGRRMLCISPIHQPDHIYLGFVSTKERYAIRRMILDEDIVEVVDSIL